MSNVNIKSIWNRPFVKTERVENECNLLNQLFAEKDGIVSKIRKPVNIAFVFDISGSMESPVATVKHNHEPQMILNRGFNGTTINSWIAQSSSIGYGKSKLQLVKEAALIALSNINENDIVSIVTFGSEARVLLKGVKGSEKALITSVIQGIRCDGMTALFEGWKTGAQCVAENMREGFLNRVLLLTDGQANVGITSPDDICSSVRGLSDTDVTTSVFGVGNDYNEDLLQAMAESGDGNYYYIKSEADFEEMFVHEFYGIMNIVGKKVRMTFEGKGWSKLELLNAFVKDENGDYRLPNLTNVNPVDILFEGLPIEQTASISITVSYEKEDGSKIQITKTTSLDIVNDRKDVYINQEVLDKVVMIKVANKKQESIRQLDMGNMDAARQMLEGAKGLLAGASAAVSSMQSTSLNSLNTSLSRGDTKEFRKSALYESYNVRNNKEK